mgnify:CR=1 FL=1
MELLRNGKNYILLGLVIGVLSGVGVGLQSALANRYFELDSRFLALHEVTATLNRHVYVALVTAAVCAVVLTGLRACGLRALRLAPFLALLVAIGYAVFAYDVPYRAGLAWDDLTLAPRLVIIAVGLAGLVLVLGQRLQSLSTRRSARLILIACAIGAFGLNLARYSWSQELQDELADKKNVLVLVVDALRDDRLTSRGYERDTTPTMDALAADGVTFTGAVSNSNHTRAVSYTHLTLPTIKSGCRSRWSADK